MYDAAFEFRVQPGNSGARPVIWEIRQFRERVLECLVVSAPVGTLIQIFDGEDLGDHSGSHFFRRAAPDQPIKSLPSPDPDDFLKMLHGFIPERQEGAAG